MNIYSISYFSFLKLLHKYVFWFSFIQFLPQLCIYFFLFVFNLKSKLQMKIYFHLNMFNNFQSVLFTHSHSIQMYSYVCAYEYILNYSFISSIHTNQIGITKNKNSNKVLN